MILVVDNYDSFTYNLVQSLLTLGCDVEVARSDAIDAAAVTARSPAAVVISPGPGRPETAGATPEIVARLRGRVPMLGVCLGHQAIGVALGAALVRTTPRHGKSSAVVHDCTGLFAGLPTPLTVGRYHSLALDPDTLPPELTVTARTGDGVVMAIAHATEPLWGVQFHPESILTPHGDALLENFLDRALAR